MGQAPGRLLDQHASDEDVIQANTFNIANGAALEHFASPMAWTTTDRLDPDVVALTKLHVPVDVPPKVLRHAFRKTVFSKLVESNPTARSIPRIIRSYCALLRRFRQELVRGETSTAPKGPRTAHTKQELEYLVHAGHTVRLLLRDMTECLTAADTLYHLEHLPVPTKKMAAAEESHDDAPAASAGLPDSTTSVLCEPTTAIPNASSQTATMPSTDPPPPPPPPRERYMRLWYKGGATTEVPVPEVLPSSQFAATATFLEQLNAWLASADPILQSPLTPRLSSETGQLGGCFR